MKAETKRVIHQVVSFTDKVTEKGEPIPMTGLPKKHAKGILSLRNKLKNSIEFAYIKGEEVVWSKVDVEGYKKDEKLARFSDGEMSIDSEEANAIKYCVGEYEEYPNMENPETLSELLKIIT